ncbi:MAG TPA: hypothetical protein VKT78_12805 [Fimbriimonadaceae bacterium]|nr:hypothetical protein [Fimbriimonadaceae bacterium]
MKNEVKTPVIAAVVIVVVGAGLFFGVRAMNSTGQLDNGQMKYTPGKPPWMESDPSKRGPGGSPGAGQASAQPAGSPSQPPASGQAAPPQAPNMPVGPPVVNNHG